MGDHVKGIVDAMSPVTVTTIQSQALSNTGGDSDVAAV